MRFRAIRQKSMQDVCTVHPFRPVRSAARDQHLSGCVTGEMKRGGNQDPNTKRFKRTLIYFDTDIQYAIIFFEIPFVKHKTTLKQQTND